MPEKKTAIVAGAERGLGAGILGSYLQARIVR
jgi:hypothetical protein